MTMTFRFPQRGLVWAFVSVLISMTAVAACGSDDDGDDGSAGRGGSAGTGGASGD
jgi:hypothetical protein